MRCKARYQLASDSAFGCPRAELLFRLRPNLVIVLPMRPFDRQVQQCRASTRKRVNVGLIILGGCWLGCAESSPPPAAPKTPVLPVAYVPPGPVSNATSIPVAADVPKSRSALWMEDVKYLEAHGPVIQLETTEHGVVAVSAKYQGRVMTSAVARDAVSLGFINRDFIDAGSTGTPFDNYGGEDRFWLGPEAGQFGLYFGKGKPFEVANWQTPAALQEGEWSVTDKTVSFVIFSRPMKLTNRVGASFVLEVKRTVRVLTNQEVLSRLQGVTTLGPVRWVGFETTNQITNKGTKAWTKKDGLLSVWILGMFNPAPDMNVVIPFERSALGEIVNDRYFGAVSGERLHVFADQGFLTFKCDAQSRGKLGLASSRAKPWLGSYSESGALLTLVNFDKVQGAKDYVNNLWEQQKEPYSGDVVNSYNDGAIAPGQPSLGGFYEMETSSPAAALRPGQSLTHVQRTLHFTGKRSDLDALAKAALGVSLDRVVEANPPVLEPKPAAAQ